MSHDDGLLIPPPHCLTQERLQAVVLALSERMNDPELRAQSQRAIQAKIWHLEPKVSQLMNDLKADEQSARTRVLQKISALVYEFHSNTLDATLARAGLATDPRLQNDLVVTKDSDLDIRCLDAKERLYVLLQQYGWLQDFFRSFPHHFYENSFAFVSRIPSKPLLCKAKVIGLGVGGSMAVSGMAKHGIAVTGVEKRQRPPTTESNKSNNNNNKTNANTTTSSSSVTSRYQNASWRAYDTAEQMIDPQAFEELVMHRQRIVINDSVVTFSDRVQIVIGHAIQTALQSAVRYGATLQFGGSEEGEEEKQEDPTTNGEQIEEEKFDICAVFCGAHTSIAFPVLDMKIFSWPKLESVCKMWLQVQPNHSNIVTANGDDGTTSAASNSCTRQGEVGAEHWNFTIASTRHSEEDLHRVLGNLDAQYARYKEKRSSSADGKEKEGDQVTAKYQEQRNRVEKVLLALRQNDIQSYDYIFTNAPSNAHNLAKREAVADTVVLDGGYNVPIQIATQSSFQGKQVQQTFHSKVVVCGGDACVPPNPLAAYGATLACESAYSSVLLAIGIGHTNAILAYMKDRPNWCDSVQELKDMLIVYYDARARAENYFQFVQTLLCNLYSLPPHQEVENAACQSYS